MGTFFPHLYEYCQFVNSLKNEKQKNIKSSKTDTVKENCIDETPPTILKKMPHQTPTFTQYYQSKDIEYLIYLEEKVRKLRESNYNPLKYYNVKISEILKARTQLASVKKYQRPKGWPSEKQQKFPESGKHWMVCDVVLCIEYAKTLPFFHKLDVEDQLEILKTMTLYNTLLTSVYYSSALNSDVLIYPDGHLPIKYQIIHKTHFDIYQRIVEPVKRIKMTKEEYILLKVIILCSAESDLISPEGKGILENELTYYSNLLLKYLQAKNGESSGAVKYSQVISVMEAIIYFAQKCREFFVWYRTSNCLGTPPLLLDEVIY